MNPEEIAVKITEHGQRLKSLQYRVDKLEKQQESTNQLVRSVDRLAQSMETMAQEQKEQGKKIDKLEASKSESLKYWVRTILAALATGVVGYILSLILNS